MARFVIMGNATEYCEVMCSDIIGTENVVFINEANNLKSNFGKLLDLIFQKVSIETKLSFFVPFGLRVIFAAIRAPRRRYPVCLF